MHKGGIANNQCLYAMPDVTILCVCGGGGGGAVVVRDDGEIWKRKGTWGMDDVVGRWDSPALHKDQCIQ